VLEALLSLAERTCRHPDYSGDRLEDLISGAIEIVATGAGQPNQQNFSTAVSLLRRVLRELDEPHSESFKQADALLAIYGMSRLGRASLQLEGDAVPLRMVQSLGLTAQRHPSTTTASSQVLFEMGVAAIDSDKILIAMSALGHLSTLVEENAPASGELVADALGLLAHFWTAGEAGREFAQQRLDQLRSCLKAELSVALAQTNAHCAQRALFRTADKVRRVERELGGVSR
jgi:hypothetical protein